jgi:hypothetical protein
LMIFLFFLVLRHDETTGVSHKITALFKRSYSNSLI